MLDAKCRFTRSATSARYCLKTDAQSQLLPFKCSRTAGAQFAPVRTHRAPTAGRAIHDSLVPFSGGGLLAGVPADCAGECLDELRSLGYLQAAIIGQTAQGLSVIDIE